MCYLETRTITGCGGNGARRVGDTEAVSVLFVHLNVEGSLSEVEHTLCTTHLVMSLFADVDV